MIGNRNEDLLREEFKRRYLVEFTRYVSGLMEESGGASATFLFLFIAMFVGSISLPFAALLGGGFLLRQNQVGGDVEAALAEAAQQIAADLQSGKRHELEAVERWLDRHLDDLPGYLDALDRREDDRKKLKSLIEQINRAGSAEGISADDRAFLTKNGIRKLKPPLIAEFPLPPRVGLGNWHFSQLDRALWRDIARKAGPRGKLLRRILGIAGWI